ncbi:disease resistance protein RGA2-like [Phalaenopsis equestris]|uniref:disease resistance protein RGA2-like n=1 Tax=Phalaenopsis equestris TaxID=78828 RepID=UPI0009E1F0A9|nr:disease resistance protein RGA2-like [Phalaenopsis equestris]
MADWVVGPIMDKIINACSVYLQDQYRWQKGMKEELERLRENHPKVQAVVSASTKAQIRDRNPALNSWIWQLRDAIDEADDVLDDFEYMKLEEEQLEQNMEETKVPSLFTRLFSEPASKLRRVCERALKKDPNLERLETIVKKLDKVSAEVSTFFPLIEKAKQEQQELELQLCEDRKTGCLPQNDFIGRGEEKDFVMQWLRKPTNEDPTHIASPTLYKNISLLSIVGHGGMGKTTLLQHIYEDLKEEFEMKMWVCVSNDFDAKKVIADILEFLNKERPHLDSLAAVQESLKAVVQSKRFLLVLDDIWEEDMRKWENVLSPLVYGGLGSKILLTTRMDSVAAMISNVIRKKKETLKIKGLEENVCLKLLNTHAFAGVENFGAHKKLTHIASLIAKKLSGSPLAAKVIGGVLNSSLNESFWMSILNSPDVLNVEPEPGHNNILPILRLSFKLLRQPLQNCFAFCGIFPQDHEFDKDDLVRMWIALGFIQESSIEGETLEDIGGRYFDALVRKSFFEEFQDYKGINYKMHDLLHELAQSISSEECFRFVGGDVLSLKIPKTIRHLYVKTENLEVLRMIKNVKSLHSLFLTSKRHGQHFTEILTEIFEASSRIRLLLIHSTYQKNMSEAIKNLRHLRYLKLTVNLTQMPRSLSSLYHLRFIICNKVGGGHCSHDFLPGDVSNFSNLRHLELRVHVSLSLRGIGKLRSLQELSEFNVKNENGYRIGELKEMSELRKLKINGLENVNDAAEARNAKFCEKRKLTDLFLKWKSDMRGGSLRNFVNSELDVNVLENLEPYKNLKRLSIFSYEGVKSAKWMYNADLISNLEYIRLDECSEWETLPPLGQLLHLKSLYLRNMPKAKRLDYKFHRNDKVSVFPSLEMLNMEGLQILENWFDEAGAAADDCFFPCLTELFLENCPNLQELPYLPPKLKKMKIQNIGWKTALICKQEDLLCPNITSSLSLGGLQQAESNIEKFQLILCDVVIDEPSLLPTVNIASLEMLRICNNDVLQSLPSSLERLSSLKELNLQFLKSLQCLPSSLPVISSLERLQLKRIPLLRSLPDLPSSLKYLNINSLDNLECLPSSLSAISSLSRLYLDSIPLLKSLPDLPSSLIHLNIYTLHNLECLPSSLSAISSLSRLYLDSIPLLKSLPDLPSSLIHLNINTLHNLECLPSSLSAISSLEELRLRTIPLKSLPDLPSSLKYLHIIRLDNLECLITYCI